MKDTLKNRWLSLGPNRFSPIYISAGWLKTRLKYYISHLHSLLSYPLPSNFIPIHRAPIERIEQRSTGRETRRKKSIENLKRAQWELSRAHCLAENFYFPLFSFIDDPEKRQRRWIVLVFFTLCVYVFSIRSIQKQRQRLNYLLVSFGDQSIFSLRFWSSVIAEVWSMCGGQHKIQ